MVESLQFEIKFTGVISQDLKDLKMKDEATLTSKARTFQVQAISSTKSPRKKKTFISKHQLGDKSGWSC